MNSGAFYVGAFHANAMLCVVRALCARQGANIPTDEQFTAIGKALLSENIKSLKRRYPGDWFERVTDEINAFTFKWEPMIVERLTCEDMRMLFVCYRYQSCEHPGWETSSIAEFVLDVTKQLDNGKPSNQWHMKEGA